MILFLKAKNPRLSQHIADLFAEQVRVEAHTDKTGRFVPEHTTTVHKRHEKPKAAKPKVAADDGPVQGDLFAEREKPAPFSPGRIVSVELEGGKFAEGVVVGTSGKSYRVLIGSAISTVQGSRLTDTGRKGSPITQKGAPGLVHAKALLDEGSPEQMVASELAWQLTGENIKISPEAQDYLETASAKDLWDTIRAVVVAVGENAHNGGDVRRALERYVSDATRPPKPAFTPTHELSDGTPVRATGEPHVYIDADGAEYEDLYAKPIARHRRAEKPAAPVVQGRTTGEAAGVATTGAEAGADAQAVRVPGSVAGQLAGAAPLSDWDRDQLARWVLDGRPTKGLHKLKADRFAALPPDRQHEIEQLAERQGANDEAAAKSRSEENANRERIVSELRGGREATMGDIRELGHKPSRIDRYAAALFQTIAGGTYADATRAIRSAALYVGSSSDGDALRDMLGVARKAQAQVRQYGVLGEKERLKVVEAKRAGGANDPSSIDTARLGAGPDSVARDHGSDSASAAAAGAAGGAAEEPGAQEGGADEVGPREGERNAEGLVFHDGRWHREDDEPAAEPAASVPEPTAPAEYRYALVNRPAMVGTIPKGGLVRVDPRPAPGEDHHDVARHGIAVFSRPLTAKETYDFELAPVLDGQDRAAMADRVAQRYLDPEYLDATLEMASEDPDWFAGAIADELDPEDKGRRPSVGDLRAFADQVLERLRAAKATPADPAAPAFGIPETATKKQRKAWNAEALRVLDVHREGEPWTDAEKASLARYSGQGGVGDSLNEYYTRNDVVGAMWSLLDAMGVAGGTILEPSCGTGAFLHQAPAGAQMVGVDLDATSSRIARILHGGEVYTQAAETFATEDPREFAAVVGNCPFGVRGALIKADKPHLPTCEQYFLDMAIDKCQAGGVVAMIVPTGIMQGMNTRAYRAALLRKGEFVDAYRLPNTAFAHSHTGVTADIVVFRAYPKELAGALSKVGDKTLERLGLWDEEFVKGGYFEGRGKGNVFGTPEAGWRAKAGMGNDFTVSGSMDGVAEAIGAMRPSARTAPPPDIAAVLEAARAEGDDATEDRIKRAASARHYEVAKVGDIKEIDGILYRLEGVPPRWHRLSGQEVEKVAALDDAPRVVDALDLLSRYPDREDLRQEAREALERYVAAHGIPSENKALVAEAKRQRGAGAARDLYRLIGAVNPDGSFSDLVTGRQAATVGATLDSVAERLALEHGGFTIEGLAQALAATDTEEIHDALYASDAYALEGDGRTWTTTAQYLTGNLWPKLDAARAMVDHVGLNDHTRAKYERQIAALEAAIAPKLLDDVEIEMRSGWVPLDALQEWMESQRQDYLREHPGAESWLKPVEVSFAKGVFTVKGGLYNRELIEKYLNREALRAERDKPVIDDLNQQFRDWVLASDRREALEDAYNRAFRGYVKPKPSDAPLDIPGLNPEFKVNAYHYAGLRWAIEAGKGIIAADVGVGKTGRGLMLGALARAHGKAKKPTYVVPKSVLANWVVEADAWFPGSNVLVIGEEYERDASGKLVRNDKGELKSKSDSPEAKARKLAMLAQNNYDFVFISQPVWNEIDLDPVSKGDLIENDFWVQRGDSLGNAGDKRLNQIRQNYAQAVAKRDFSERSGAAYFNDLGIDMLILDEAHAFKNLFSIRARWGDNPKFLGGGGLSNRAHDTDLKAAWFRDHNGNQGIYGLTATPTKNSPLEIYSMLHHFAPEAFEAIGIKNSEEFIDRFVTFEQDSILSTTGEIESALVCAGFKNLDELRPIMDRYIDRTTAADVGLKIPERDVREHWSDMTEQQAALYAELREAAKPSDGGESEHIFRIIDRMSKAALDPSLLGHEAAESPKIAAAVAQMMEGAKEGGQVVFCDYLDAHERIRDELIAKGVDPKRIAICNAKVASSATARQGISDRFNAGKLDYVIGNTATMGEGMNLQKRTTDIHHLDLPWEPASLQQRNGRGLRQGNIHEAVRIHTYFAKGSFDGYRWQTLTAKKDWQDLLWNGGDTVENLARQSGLSRLDMQILFSADPEAERAKLEGATAEALARKNAEEQAAAAGEFVRFQELKRSYSELKDKGSKSATALAQRIANEATRLRANRHFAHKAALDSDLPALVHPQTGELWQPGTALEMDGSSEQPYNWSSAPSKWVVTHVNPRDKTVTVRLWASNGKDGRQTTLGLDKLVHGYRQIPYVSEDEQAEILRAARVKELGAAVGTVSHLFPDPQKVNADVTRALADATEGVQDWHKKAQTRAAVHVAILDALSAAVDRDRAAAKEPAAAAKVEAAAASIYRAALFGAHGLAKVDDLADLRSVAPETLVSLGPDIQAHFRERADSYNSITPTQYMPLIGPGGPHLAASYDARRRIQSGHDAMLPTEANLEAAIAAAVQMERTKKLRAEYRQARKNSESKRVGTSAQYSQAGDAYGLYGAKTNPWRGVIEHVWGSEAAGRVDAAITRAWQEDMAKATDAAGALQAARTGLQHTAYGGMTSVPKDVAAALRAKLGELGALDTRASESRAFTQDSELRDVLGLSHYYPNDTVGQALARKGI